MWLQDQYRELQNNCKNHNDFEKLLNQVGSFKMAKQKKLTELNNELANCATDFSSWSVIYRDISYELETRKLEIETKLKSKQEEYQLHQLYNDQRYHLINRYEQQIATLKLEKAELESIIEKAAKLEFKMSTDINRLNFQIDSTKNKQIFESKQTAKNNNSQQLIKQLKSQQLKLHQQSLEKEKNLFLTTSRSWQLSTIVPEDNNNQDVRQSSQLSVAAGQNYLLQLFYLEKYLLDVKYMNVDINEQMDQGILTEQIMNYFEQKYSNKFELIFELIEHRIKEEMNLSEEQETQILYIDSEKTKLIEIHNHLIGDLNELHKSFFIGSFESFKQPVNIENADFNDLEEVFYKLIFSKSNSILFKEIQKKDDFLINHIQFVYTFYLRISKQIQNMSNLVHNQSLTDIANNLNQQSSNQSFFESDPLDFDIIALQLIEEFTQYCTQEFHLKNNPPFSQLLDIWQFYIRRPLIKLQVFPQQVLENFKQTIQSGSFEEIHRFTALLNSIQNIQQIPKTYPDFLEIMIDDIIANQMLKQIILIDQSLFETIFLKIKKLLKNIEKVFHLIKKLQSESKGSAYEVSVQVKLLFFNKLERKKEKVYQAGFKRIGQICKFKRNK